MPKNAQSTAQLALISHASKVMLKILQARLQQYVNREVPDVQAGLRKGRGTRDQIANIRWIMEKAREFKKIRDSKGTFHAKMGSIKDRNGMDLTEAEDIKRWQVYTEKLYKKDLHNPDNHDGVITHLEPVFLECEVKWALGSITMN